MRDLKLIERRLQEWLPAYLGDLRTLVEIDSGTFNKRGVDRVADFLQAQYAALGAHIERHHDETRGLGDTIVATIAGPAPGRVLLLGHTDTVYPDGTAARRPFRVEGDRGYGPGVADMKAGDLSIVYALRALLVDGRDQLGTIVVVHNSDEEIGSPSSRDLIRARSQEADAVLVLEPGRENGDVVSARKGIAGGCLEVRGVAAHAGVNKDRGRSAALELAHLVIALEGINGTIPGVTVNVGVVKAGERVNVVPDNGEARFEIRAFESDRLQEAMERVRQIAAHPTVPDVTAAVELEIEHSPMPRTPAIERMVRLARGIAAEIGFDLHDTSTGGASDGNTAASAGRPVLDALGPIGGQAHSPDEYIEVASIVPRVTLVAGLIDRLGRGYPPKVEFAGYMGGTNSDILP